MTTCAGIPERLDETLDGGAAPADVAGHLAACEPCRRLAEDLRLVHDGARRHFDAVRAAAPAFPEAILAATPARPWRRRLMALASAAAAGLLVWAGLSALPDNTARATPADIVARAAARLRALADLEFRATIGLDIVDTLTAIFGKDSVKGPETPPPSWRFQVRRDAFLLRPDGADAPGTITGFDGKEAWSYDPEKKELRLGDASGTKITIGGTEVSMKRNGLLDLFTWKFVDSLGAGGEKSAEVTELTAEPDRRVGRRVFRVVPHSGDGSEHARIVATLTIDPARDLIERGDFELKLFGFGLLRLRLDLVAVDQGLAPGHFEWKSHVPADGITVIREPSDRK